MGGGQDLSDPEFGRRCVDSTVHPDDTAACGQAHGFHHDGKPNVRRHLRNVADAGLGEPRLRNPG